MHRSRVDRQCMVPRVLASLVGGHLSSQRHARCDQESAHMTAPVRIDAAAWGDLRFATLARLCGFADAEHALIKCAKIWAWQTEHYTDERPTYVVDPEIVESALGPGSASHLVRARLAEEGPAGLRIRGSEKRIEWLFRSRSSSKLGGEATKRKHANKTRPDGYAGAKPTPEPTPEPNLGALTLSLDLDQRDTHTRARSRHPSAGGIARRVWDHGAKVRAELAASNVHVVPWAITIGSEHPGWIALLDRVCELLVSSTVDEAERICRNRVDVAAAKARADGDGQWFSSLAMFTVNSFATFAQLDPQSFARKPPRQRAVGELIGSAPPRSDHPEGTTLVPAGELF